MSYAVEIFFDAECPLCKREVALLQRMDKKRQLRFTDIAAPGFDAHALGKQHHELMARIHGRLPDASWLEGVEVFRRAYAAVGFGPLVAITRLPGVSHGLEAAYRVFARNRLRWTGRCDSERCVVRRSGAELRGSGAL